MASINPHTTRANGTILTATIYNNDHDNHISNVTAVNTELEALSPFDPSDDITWTGVQTWTHTGGAVGSMERDGSAGSNQTILTFERAGTQVGQIAGQDGLRLEVRSETGHELRLNSNGSGANGVIIDTAGTLVAGLVDIGGGAIDGTVIGANSAAAGTFTTLTGSVSAAIPLTLNRDGSSGSNQVLIDLNRESTAVGLIAGQNGSFMEVRAATGHELRLAANGTGGNGVTIDASGSLLTKVIDGTGADTIVATLNRTGATGTNRTIMSFEREGTAVGQLAGGNGLLFELRAESGCELLLNSNGSGSNGITVEVDGDVTMDGDLTVAGDVTANSDRRLKEDIRDLGPMLNLLLQVRPRRYRRIGFEREHIGLVSQELQPLLPELVSENENGLQSVNYSKLCVALLGAFQELAQVVHGR